MPFNGSGTFTIVNTFVPNTTILSAAVNQNFSDIATGLSDVLTRDGQAGMTAAFKAIGGSVSAPGISFNSDATAGLYLDNTGIVGLVAKSLGLLVNSSIYQAASATVQAGGSGYAVGDNITLTGGTAINQTVLTVATLSGSAVATVTIGYPGNYSVVPSNPVSQGSTNGVGSGATFNVTFAAQFASSIVTDEAGNVPWRRLGSSSFVSGLMAKANGLDFATAIGGANIAAVVGSSFILPPQGILTTVNSTTAPIPTTDQTAITKVYWTPYNGGNGCPIYNGTSFVNVTSGQINCDLIAGTQVLGGIFDVYKFLSAGVVHIGFGPTWSAGTSGSVTAGSCARGTGTGGAALTWISGIPVNAVAMTCNDGSGTFSVPANQGTYLGSIYVNGTAGQINCLIGFGQSRVWGLWNAWNKNPIVLKAGDSTASFSPGGSAGGTLRPTNNNSANSSTLFCGLAEEKVDNSYYQLYTAAQTAGNSVGLQSGIGFNSTTAASGVSPNTSLGSSASSSTIITENSARFVTTPFIGINVVTMLEGATPSGPSASGTEKSCCMISRWRG